MPLAKTATEALAITLFGPMEVRVQGRLLPPFRSRKALWVLALLTLRHERPVEREWLAGTLWPDIDQSQALANLRPVLSELRRRWANRERGCTPPIVMTLLLDLTDAEVDVLRFDAAITSRNLCRRGAGDSALSAALCWKAATKSGWGRNAPAGSRDACRRCNELGEAALAGRHYATADRLLSAGSHLDPWSDAARRGWMEALAKNGDRNAALQVYREFVHYSGSDPTAAPDELTSALYQRLRAEAARQPPARGNGGSEGRRLPLRVVTGYLPHPLTELVGTRKRAS